ncbi:hypothetical protein MHZ36_12865 [Staphylococcus sp. ACRSN]|uniref:hypothetical protein n=1 Tax=Staphylococcus sp. ACRSN TaxID=2918214 RepID=UPI001EF1A006|nr:hypothetical protein [Staphylococcus sp. ACRSN]MCG7340181.1 hypothetical protein [Staphylococcus sp. ACRSN]
MIATVSKLINSNISAAEIYRQTGVVATTIKKLRLGKQDINTMKYYTLKKLYDYQVSLDEKEIDGDSYNDLQSVYEKLEESDDYKEKYQELLNLNTKVGIKFRKIIKPAIEDERTLEDVNRYIDLLVTHEELK